jgi:hypothetical protein
MIGHVKLFEYLLATEWQPGSDVGGIDMYQGPTQTTHLDYCQLHCADDHLLIASEPTID